MQAARKGGGGKECRCNNHGQIAKKSHPDEADMAAHVTCERTRLTQMPRLKTRKTNLLATVDLGILITCLCPGSSVQ